MELLTPAIGAEVSGLDVSKPIAEKALGELHAVWLERKVLVFRDQSLTPGSHVAFARQFGEVDKYPFLKGIEGHPLVAPYSSCRTRR